MRVRVADLSDSKLGEKIYSTEPTPDLIESIRTNGVLVPIWIAKDNTIIAGHRRVNACKALGIEEIEAEVREYSDLLVIESNRYREKTWAEKLREKEELDRILGPKAEQRMKAGKPNPDSMLNQGRTLEHVAKAIGTSVGTLHKVQAIAKAKPELIAEIDQGKKSVEAAYRLVKTETQLKRLADITVPPPKGQYRVIVVDPPWPMQKIGRDVRPNQVAMDYPVMSEESIAQLVLPCADDCHVWLWTTHRFLPRAFEILKDWGCKYVCTFVWHKPGGFQPYGLPQYNCEFALYARRGNPVFRDTKSFDLCFAAERGEHSQKPAAFYEMVCRVTDGPRLDMFNRKPIDGFDGWGNEAIWLPNLGEQGGESVCGED